MSTRRGILSALLAVLLLGSCEGATAPTGPAAPARVDAVAGNEQKGVVGRELPQPLVVRVLDAAGNPVAGQLLDFRVVAGGGSLLAGSGLTNADGIAQDRWTLGTVADTQRVEARAVDAGTGQSLVLTTFVAVGQPDVPASIVAVPATDRTGQAGMPLADSLVARVTDRYGNPTQGIAVVWAVRSGGGRVSPEGGFTDATGTVRAHWTLGPRMDSVQVVEAAVAPSVVATFRATAAIPLGAVVSKVSGDAQRGTVATELPTALVLSVTLPDGRPLAGMRVTWTMVGGSASPATGVTDANGRASTRWTLGTISGAQSASAAVEGAGFAAFSAIAGPDAPASLSKVAGDAQSGVAGTELPTPLAVRVVDRHGNRASGVPVRWAAANGTVAPATTSTDGTGVAQARWTVGTTPGPQGATATVEGLPAVSFSATATVGGAGALSKTAGDAQTGPVGAQLPTSLQVRVVDGAGNPVPGALVRWTAGIASGTVSPDTSRTSASGLAETRWTLATTPGSQSVAAATDGVAPVAFAATATPDVPATLSKTGGDGQSANVGTQLPSALSVRVVDRYGNANAGVLVRWTTSGGVLLPDSSRTDANGATQSRWTLGPAAGTQTATATVAGLPPASFVATAQTPAPGGPGSASVTGGDGQTGTVGTELPNALVVRVLDESGNPRAGVTVTWAAATGSGSLAPATSTTNATGHAESRWTLGATVGAQSATATVAGLSPLTFSATGQPAAPTGPATLAKVAGDLQTGLVGTQLATPLQVRVTDAAGNPLPNVIVRWTPAPGYGYPTPVESGTSTAGVAESRWTLGAPAGAQTLQASVTGLTPLTFTASAALAPGPTFEKTGDGQTAASGAALPNPLTVRLVDASGQPMEGHRPLWEVVSGGGSLNVTIPVTTAAGNSRATWQLGPTVGAQTVRVSLPGVPSVTFTAQASGAMGFALVNPLPARVGDNLSVSVRVTTPIEAAEVTATVEGRTVSLTFANGVWSGTLSLTGVPRGQHMLTISGRDVVGGTGSTQFPFMLDRPIQLVLDEELINAVARPGLRVRARCIDDDPTPCTIIAYMLGPEFIQATGQMDAVINLASSEGQARVLYIVARDSEGEQTSLHRFVYVESSTRLTEIGWGGTRMLDVDAGRLLFVDSTATWTDARVRLRTGGPETTIPHAWQGIRLNGFLTDQGAMLEVASTETRFDPGVPPRVVEWRDGATALAIDFTGFGSLVVSRPWAIWSAGNEFLYRRDLTAGTTTQVGQGRQADVAPNGDVVFASLPFGSPTNVYRYRAGTLAPLTSSSANVGEIWHPATDGVNVAYTAPASTTLPKSIVLHTPTGPQALAPAPPEERRPPTHYEVNNGWTAFLRSDRVWSRAPDGTERQVSVFGAGSTIDAVGPSGEIVFRSGGRRYLHTAPYTGSAVDIGAAWESRVFFNGSELIVLIGRSAFTVN